jgi:chromosome segregation protein
VSGLLGSVAALLTVLPGYEAAVASALGSAADAVAVEHVDAALGAIEHLKSEDLGRAGIVLGTATVDDRSWPGLPDGVTYAVDVVECPAALRPALSRLLFKVAVVDDLQGAKQLVADVPDLTAVTRDGDLLGAHFASGGSSSQPSLIEVQAAVDEAAHRLGEATRSCERLGFELARLEDERAQAQHRVDVALAKLHESDATLAAVAEELGQLGSLARSARGEAERIAAAIATAQEARDRDLAGLDELEQRLVSAEDSSEEDPDTTLREQLADRARTSRQAEMDARLALRTTEERARALSGRADALLEAARAERDERARAAARRERMIREGAVAEAVGRGVALVLQRLEVSVAAAAEERAGVEQGRRGREERLMAARSRLRDLAGKHDELVNTVHRDEMARTQQRMRIEQLEERARDELGLDLDSLVADYGPAQPVPPVLSPEQEAAREADQSAVPPEPVPFVREEQQKRLRSAERALSMLGKINPLALEEFSALEERHQFLGEQLEDLRKTRRDLLDIVREVDERVEQVFTEAWHDVEREFESVFRRLFPGGEGRLVLTEPSELLTTGVDVEARPPGKKVKRLSLLSGGERSLVAVAFLVALFKARPSPFYILDEVEAALDDTNLGRLLEIYEELRENSQLLVITHQKRTMEVGDALYGVSMRGDGVSAVISQRLREAEPA